MKITAMFLPQREHIAVCIYFYTPVYTIKLAFL